MKTKLVGEYMCHTSVDSRHPMNRYPMSRCPMKLNPIYKDYLWGGNSLNKLFNKNSGSSITAESWELSCLEGNLCTVDNGIFKGQTLKYVLTKFPEMFMQNCSSDEHYKDFPLLIKLIDASDMLSIQVHPSNLTADASKNQQGKAEMWIVLHCEKDAYIYLGFNQSTNKEDFKKKITDGTLCDILNKVPVKKGDVFYIAPGTVHAIGKGILIAEIQQSSNTTFRLFDYNRKDHNGQTRELHVDEAIRVTNYEPFIPTKSSHKIQKKENYSMEQLVHNEYFKVDKYIIHSSIDKCVSECFQSILFIDGCCNIIYNNEKYKAIKGDTFFLPAGMGDYTIDGECQFILATV